MIDVLCSEDVLENATYGLCLGLLLSLSLGKNFLSLYFLLYYSILIFGHIENVFILFQYVSSLTNFCVHNRTMNHCTPIGQVIISRMPGAQDKLGACPKK